MIVHKTFLEGVLLLKNFFSEDERGEFLKLYNKKSFEFANIKFDVEESFISISRKNVIRGMHFQLPPHDHDKLVSVVNGRIVDVILDLRRTSKTYKKFVSVELSDRANTSIFIPRGCAHGFRSLENNTVLIYHTSSVHFPTSDSGINYDSFGYDWELDNPIISSRDLHLYEFEEFCKINPF